MLFTGCLLFVFVAPVVVVVIVLVVVHSIVFVVVAVVFILKCVQFRWRIRRVVSVSKSDSMHKSAGSRS